MDAASTTDADDALAQPTRARLFALLAELKRPAATRELAERLGLHPNGVRTHLERLERAGLAERRTVSGKRGRPRHEWSLTPEARPPGARGLAYVDLARWLAGSIPPRQSRLREVEAEGRRIGRQIAPSRGSGAGDDALGAAFAALGFRPRRRIDRHGATYRLGACPYLEAAAESPDVVCTLHRGITHGLLDALVPDASLASFEPHDPRAAGCVVRVARR